MILNSLNYVKEQHNRQQEKYIRNKLKQILRLTDFMWSMNC